jgi:putative colanic acid biosynthesis glycosyltransferase WcaI
MKRLLVLNQYYWPGIEATAQLLTELCEGLAGKYRITVVAGTTAGAGPGKQVRNGVEIIRVPSTAFSRRRLPARAFNYLTYVTLAALRGLGTRRPDLVLCGTDPPFVGAAACLVARRFDVPLVAVMKDVFPETAVELGRLESPVVVAALDRLIRFYLQRAERVVAIGETMRRRLVDKGVPPERLRVIPDWVDTDAIRPPQGENTWRRQQGLDGRLVVMHSGNIGHAQDLETLIRASTLLGDVERLSVVVVGDGARRSDLEALAAGLGADRVRFLPYQPREVLPQSLAAADAHFVGLAGGLSGYVVPSRLYGVLAAGRPAIVAADEDSEPARLVRDVECGLAVPPGRPDLLADVIRAIAAGEHDLEAMGRRGREFVVSSANPSVGIRRYEELFTEILEP